MKYNNILITGGAGFIGSNLTYFLLSKGCRVTIFDNLSRKMVKNNLKWLKSNFSENLILNIEDVRNREKIFEAVKDKDLIFHLAAQVAVTDSVKDPLEDFEINAIGSLNILEGIRKYCPNSPVLYSSTNKVYGEIDWLKSKKKDQRYVFEDKNFLEGINENIQLDFYSPYGCSKGTADQYFRDYSRIYNLKTIIFRQSCIYGNRQYGNEDQGWVMHFLKNAIEGKEISIYGDGRQVRDILYVDDLIDAYVRAVNTINKTKGQIYNIGGGYKNSTSLIELIHLIKEKFNTPIKYSFQDWRPGDQKIFYCDIKKAFKDFGWQPKNNINDGLDKLYNWVKQII